MDLATLMRKLEQTGSRLDSLEGKIAKIARVKGRLRFWQGMAALGIGAAVVLFFAYLDARRHLEQCEKRGELAA